MNSSRGSKRTGLPVSSTTSQPGDSFPSKGGYSGARMASSGKGSGEGKNKLLNKMTKMTSWLATSEPSAQALRQHKKESFSKAGIPLDDPNKEANIKLHAPIGEIPPTAITPTSSLSPEDLAKKKAAERLRRKLESHGSRAGSGSRTSHSSSGLSLASPSASPKASFAWDVLPFDGTNRSGSGVDRG